MPRPLVLAAVLLLQCGGAYGFSFGGSMPVVQRRSGLVAACRSRPSRAGKTTVVTASSKDDAEEKGKWRGPGIPFKEKEYSVISASDGALILRVSNTLAAMPFLSHCFPSPCLSFGTYLFIIVQPVFFFVGCIALSIVLTFCHGASMLFRRQDTAITPS